MWPLPRPNRTPLDTYRLCVSGVANGALRARFQLVEPRIVASADAFEVACTNTRLHTLVAHDSVDGRVTRVEMSSLYSGRMATQGRPGRAVYDELLRAPAYGRCPLCGQRAVSTLDHHLPQSRFPSLTVAPFNLIPACAECNKAKLHSVPATAEEETIHPYFDNLGQDTWLQADVVMTVPAALTFSVSPPRAWSAVLTARVRHHFSLLRLATLYTSHAAEEIVSIRQLLDDLYAKAGVDGVRAHLTETATSFAAVRANSWQVATYRALAASDWYCDRGFSAI